MREITHEEVLLKIKDIDVLNDEEYYYIKDYITQQQAKEKRAKKEHELLELYRKGHARVSMW